jgi:tripartite-type tricarboxylate transporter receptor subunit TctC
MLVPSIRAMIQAMTWTFAASTAVLAASPAYSQLHNFNGQTITLLVGSDVGAGFDAYGRLAARHLGRFLPGNPAVVVKNMPGAAGVRLANWVYSAAPRDGTTIALVQTGTPWRCSAPATRNSTRPSSAG